MTVLLPDGYNGHKAKFYIKPLEVDGDLLKLQCAEHGKEYMFRWVHKTLLKEANNMIITRSAMNNRDYIELHDRVFCNKAGAECNSGSCRTCTIFNSPEPSTFGREIEGQEKINFTHKDKSYVIEVAGYGELYDVIDSISC